MEYLNTNASTTKTLENPTSSFLNSNSNSTYSDSRLDIEIYVMGEMKIEFMCFLGECFKDNFFETLSWGNFRRFQLILSNKKNWINVHFIFLRNEMSADVLINTFKIYEKRNFTLLFYNANDQKSEKHVESLYESLISERNKFFEGILNDESIYNNLKKISSTISTEVTEGIKNNLKFLTDNSSEENLIYKIGFYPNLTNKKTKNIKKADVNTSYEVNGDYFYINGQEETCGFDGLLEFILVESFKKLRINQNLTGFLEVIKFSPRGQEVVQGKKPKKKLIYFLKIIEWMIVLYILVSFYKFIIDHN
jgi:hypothetical protein